jgi:replicative DNA helicase
MKPQNIFPLDLGKIPPQACDIEDAVLGALMLEKGAYDRITLKPCEFYKEANQKIFSAIQELEKNNNPIDYLSVCEKLKENNLLDDIGGSFYISQLTGKVISANNIEHHALIIHDKFIKRQCIVYCSELMNKAYDDALDTFDVMDYANIELDKINNDILIEDDVLTFKEVIKNTLESFQERVKLYKEGKSIGIPTPIQKLTKYTSGWQPKDFIVIGARPGAGKTALALAILKTAAESNKSVYLASLEMSSIQLGGRILVGTSGINADNFKFGNVEGGEWEKLEKAIQKLENLPIFIDDKPKNINRIKSKAKLLHRKGQCDMLIIDYIQLASIEGENSSRNREQEISYISRTCKTIGMELDIPVIALSQLNREVEKRTVKKPGLSDLRESGSIEQDADIVLFIYRPEMYGLTEDENGNAYNGRSELIIAKHRNGQTGIIDFRFNESLTAVYDYDEFDNNSKSFEHFNPYDHIDPNSRIESNISFSNETPF